MAHFGASFKTLHILYVYITITNKYSVSFSLHTLLSDGRTAAARCTSVRRTSRRTLTTIAKSRRSSRKDFNDFVRLKTATRRRASSWIRKRHISTAVDLAAATLSKINQTWVRAGALQILCLYQFRLWDIMFLSRPFRPSVRALWKLWTRYFWKGMNGICCKLAQVFHGGTQVFHWGGKGMKRSTLGSEDQRSSSHGVTMTFDPLLHDFFLGRCPAPSTIPHSPRRQWRIAILCSQNDKFGCILPQFLTGRKHGSLGTRILQFNR